jgi:hypothetical protein
MAIADQGEVEGRGCLINTEERLQNEKFCLPGEKG